MSQVMNNIIRNPRGKTVSYILRQAVVISHQIKIILKCTVFNFSFQIIV